MTRSLVLATDLVCLIMRNIVILLRHDQSMLPHLGSAAISANRPNLLDPKETSCTTNECRPLGLSVCKLATFKRLSPHLSKQILSM
jgi:hypothetical protein